MSVDYMRNAILLIALVAASICWRGTLAQGGTPAPSNPLVLIDDEDEYRLDPHLQLLEDPTGELTIDDITSPEFSARFVPNHGEVPNLGYTSSAYWIRLPVRNLTSLVEDWILELEFSPHYLDLYIPEANGDEFKVWQTGSLRPANSRDIFHPGFAFNLSIPPASEQVYYLRIASGASMTVPLVLRSPNVFYEKAQRGLVAISLFLGLLIALCLYNAVLFVVIRDKSYLFLTLLLASMIVFELIYSGFADLFFPSASYWLQRYIQTLIFSIFLALLIPFTVVFLDLKQQFRRLYWINIAVLIGWGVMILLIPTIPYIRYASSGLVYALLSSTVVLATTILVWVRGAIKSRFFMIAWFGMLLALGTTIMVRIGLLPSILMTEHAYEFGIAWMAICWSVALADSINLLKLRVERNESRLSQILEGMPVGVVMYDIDRTPSYANKRVFDILSNPARNIQPDLSIGRTLDEAMTYFSFRKEGSDQAYPLAEMPVHRALQGEAAMIDNIEADLIDRRVSLEIWASPIEDDEGDVEAAIVALQDISSRKLAQAKLAEYRLYLEKMVEQRTSELSASNMMLNREIARRKYLAAFQLKLITWLSTINETQQSLHGTEQLAKAHERLLPEIRRLTDAVSALLIIWSEATDRFRLLTCLRKGDFEPVLIQLDGSHAKTSSLHQITTADQLLILPHEPDHPTLAPLASCLDDAAVKSIILAPINTERGSASLLVLGMEQPTDSFTDDDVRLLERIRVDLASLNDYALLAETTLELAAAEERSRLAQDLHDSVTQVLFSASLLAEALPTIWQRDPVQASESLEGLKHLTRSALAEMRTLLLELRPSSLIKTPLHDLLAQLTEAVLSRANLPSRLLIEQIPALPEGVQVTCYRVAQEALNNVVKHAAANQVTVRLYAMPIASQDQDVPESGVRLEIMDDGIGFESSYQRAGAMGLNIMQERANQVGADLSVMSQIGGGTAVTLTWPSRAESIEREDGAGSKEFGVIDVPDGPHAARSRSPA